ncbi:MAG: hypothetical protein V1887_01405 [Candidatus Aenigmatarchaeota archaeon]
MKLSKERIAGMIGPISKRPALLRGTAVESVLTLFETGKLFPDRRCDRNTRDYLYFVPVSRELPVSLRDDGWRSRSDAIESAELYAADNGEERHIMECIMKAGIPKSKAEMIKCEWLCDISHRIPAYARKIANGLDYKDIYKRAEKYNGVIIEVGKGVLGMKLEIDPEGEGVRLRCPSGLPAKYVKRIEPQGRKEKEILKTYLAGKRNYQEHAEKTKK